MSQASHRVTEWIYRGVWAWVVRWFRVPEQAPTLPAMDQESIQRFRPADGFLRYLKFQFWILLAVIDVALIVLWIVLGIAAPVVAVLIAPVALAVIVIPDVIAYVAIHLRFDTTWYVLSDRSLRIRRGIWILRETTITFENIQNVSVEQGPLQRYFGIADVMVQTAGGGVATGQEGAVSFGHHGLLEGVANAAEIRDLILHRLRLTKSAGVSDDDSIPEAEGTKGLSREHLSVLREIHAATSKLRQVGLRAS